MEKTNTFKQTVEVEELICLPEFPMEVNFDIDDNGPISPIKFQDLHDLMLEDDEFEDTNNASGKFCLVQQWNSILSFQHHIVFIKDCDLHLNPLQVFYTTTTYEDAFQKWLLLWKRCFKMAYESTVFVQEQNWFLLQKTTEHAIVTYQIVEKNKFDMRYNLFMVNHPVYGAIYQVNDNYQGTNAPESPHFVHILRFAINDFKLVAHLKELSLVGSNEYLYAAPIVDEPIIEIETKTDESFDDDILESHLEYEKEIEKTLKICEEREEIMNEECAMLMDIMDKVRDIKINLTKMYKEKLKKYHLPDEGL